jgi:ABC-type nitrate/sulfonate/bicarbonate transport system permease component
MVYIKPLSLWFLPLMIISQAIPTFAIAPLLVIWFGYGMASKIICTILMIFFPITSAFFDGLRQTERHWLDLAKTMNAKKIRLFYYIRIPAALPRLASGMRIAAVFAPIGAVIGEWVGASGGLGFLMLNANARMQIDLMFAALCVLILLSLLLYFIIDRICARFIFEKVL